MLFRKAGWQVEDNKAFRIDDLPATITGVAIMTYTPVDEAKDPQATRVGRWHLIGESHKTIYYAFRAVDIPTCGSRETIV